MQLSFVLFSTSLLGTALAGQGFVKRGAGQNLGRSLIRRSADWIKRDNTCSTDADCAGSKNGNTCYDDYPHDELCSDGACYTIPKPSKEYCDCVVSQDPYPLLTWCTNGKTGLQQEIYCVWDCGSDEKCKKDQKNPCKGKN
ncbi:hypothetical protein CKM354_001010500 [Cercospora kikuchii]|uniref:Uncharacterized protein n=1 Tax=Cercospora kikuchii TaxID=84275 RepID=A0A9P3CQE6_9PEZI|nr:uncharacterized protein CKM354_001010500 [Cercospora kikuchii]GIZ47003.1 hypothetical protein CKM354_001010500 [Cercospora kikuchii]